MSVIKELLAACKSSRIAQCQVLPKFTFLGDYMVNKLAVWLRTVELVPLSASRVVCLFGENTGGTNLPRVNQAKLMLVLFSAILVGQVEYL